MGGAGTGRKYWRARRREIRGPSPPIFNLYLSSLFSHVMRGRRWQDEKERARVEEQWREDYKEGYNADVSGRWVESEWDERTNWG